MLRRLAAQKLAQEKPGQTLQATALVHEAYVRVVGAADDQHWDNRCDTRLFHPCSLYPISLARDITPLGGG